MTEAQLQAQCFKSHWNSWPLERGLLYMNHNTPKNAAHGAHLRAIGMVSGVADMTYLFAGGVIFLEFKAPSGGRQSEAQIQWQNTVTKIGCKYEIIRSIEDFYKAIGK